MHQFEQDMEINEQEPCTYTGNVTDNWSINGIPNGGYLLSLMAKAMMNCSDKKATPILTASYMARCLPGEAALAVEKVSQSTQFDRLQARLIQEGQEKIRALGTFSIETDECSLCRYETAPPEIADLQDCTAIPEFSPKYTLYSQMDVRLDPACAGWMMDNRLAEKSEHKGWIKFKDDRPHDILSIALMADSFPPPVLASQGMVAWVPTIEFSLNIRNIPKTEWLKCIFRTRFINCGLLEEDGEIWDEDGELVAVSRQIAQFRMA